MGGVEDFLEPVDQSPPKYPCADVEEIYPVLEQEEELAELLEVIKYGCELEAGSTLTEGAGRTAVLIDNLEKTLSYYADRTKTIRHLSHGQSNTLIQYLIEKGHLKREGVDRVRWDAVQEPDRLAKIICHNRRVEVRIE